MQIQSVAFAEGQMIPQDYTCDGVNINPPLTFSDVPAGAASLALIMDDPDAPGGTFTHWTIWNISPDVLDIPENAILTGTVEGKNSSGEEGYRGPCPPHGTHRYRFTLYALDSMLETQQDSDVDTLRSDMQEHILGQETLTGLYARE